MKTKIVSLKLFRLALAAVAVTIACELSISPAQAAYIVTLQESGSFVFATGSGTVDLTALFFQFVSGNNAPDIAPGFGEIATGPNVLHNADLYIGLTGPTSFGSAGQVFANIGAGDFVSISNAPIGIKLEVPQGYVSGSALSSSSTYTATFAGLGVLPGSTHVWTWGTGDHADSFTLQIGPAGVPDTGSTFGLLLLAVSGVLGVSRLRSRQLA